MAIRQLRRPHHLSSAPRRMATVQILRLPRPRRSAPRLDLLPSHRPASLPTQQATCATRGHIQFLRLAQGALVITLEASRLSGRLRNSLNFHHMFILVYLPYRSTPLYHWKKHMASSTKRKDTLWAKASRALMKQAALWHVMA